MKGGMKGGMTLILGAIGLLGVSQAFAQAPQTYDPMHSAPAVASYQAGAIEIMMPWSRATPGGARVAAGYMMLRNASSEPDALVSVAAPEIAGRTEIHEVVTDGGVSKMRAIPRLAVPVKGEATLKPGGYHVMFLDLKRPLKEKDTFKGVLTFEKAGSVEVVFTVRALGATAHGH